MYGFAIGVDSKADIGAPSTSLETFPFPAGLTPGVPTADYADDPRPPRPRRSGGRGLGLTLPADDKILARLFRLNQDRASGT
ncbi:MAG: hypothetical protein ACTSVG_08505 [Alphaproteobacteria bacterium]